MAKFYKLKVADVRKETKDSVSIAFEVPSDLKEEYSYKQGQYLTLKLHVNGEEIRRSYSLCSSPVTDQHLRVAIKRVKDGKGSNYLNEKVKAGDEMEVMTPMGTFFSELVKGNRKQYVLFAGGSGITPMLSIIKTTLAVEPDSTLVLFYGNLDEESVIFKKEIDEIAGSTDKLKVHYIFDHPKNDVSDKIYKGIMDSEKVRILCERFVDRNHKTEYFICGPSGMMDSVKNSLDAQKIEKHAIHIEYFTTSLDTAKAAKEATDAKTPKLNSTVTVIMDGSETTFDLASDGQSILDAALDHNVDVPFACKGAVCCTCRAKLKEGSVIMEMNYALSDDEVKEGYILTCQSHPVTDRVVVDYDTP
jgi:ring-1,2-phenylacetyl-CoA epoxidase subunit PaaE